MLDLQLIGYALFGAAFLGGVLYLRRTGRETPARDALLLIVSAAIFLVPPFYIAVGNDREGILIGIVAFVMAILPPVIIIFVASRK